VLSNRTPAGSEAVAGVKFFECHSLVHDRVLVLNPSSTNLPSPTKCDISLRLPTENEMETYPFTANAIFMAFRHSRMFLAGPPQGFGRIRPSAEIQGPELDPRLKHSGVTRWESPSVYFHPQFSKGCHEVGEGRACPGLDPGVRVSPEGEG